MDGKSDSSAGGLGELDAVKYRPLRVWPAILLVAGMFAARYVPKFFEDESILLLIVMVMGPLALGVLLILWWLSFSRATAWERVAGLVGVVVLGVVSVLLSDKSMMGPAVIVASIPLGLVAFGIGVVLFGRMLSFNRTWLTLFLAFLGFGFAALLASDGMWGNGTVDWRWRWTPTAEQTMLAEMSENPVTPTEVLPEEQLGTWLANPEWPQFRGSDAFSRQNGSSLALDWKAHPPKEVWRIPMGPGWSSFSVAGNLLFTQEQMGDFEAVNCYAADSGKRIWRQEVESRFYDSIGGPGPRATPTISGGDLFAMGAAGELLRLDGKTGEIRWQVNVQKVADRKPPEWGFSSSPLVLKDLVIVHAGGADDKGILAFDIESGQLRWSAASGDHTYASAQRWDFAGKTYVLMATNAGLNILEATTGESVFDYDWPIGGYRCLQPQVVDESSILLASAEKGTRLIRLTKSESGFESEDVWNCDQLRPDFNDFVVHKDFLYGFHGSIFVCVDMKTGERVWKGGRYGKGQVLLLADSDALLVMSEKGEAILVAADGTEHRELSKLRVFRRRTWNHPVVIGDMMFVRNGEEAACYRLQLE